MWWSPRSTRSLCASSRTSPCCPAEGRLEAVGRELDQQAERILEVDRVHEPAVLDAAVPDAALVEPLHRLGEGGLRDRERDVVHAARVRRRARRVGRPILVGEDRDEASVAGVEVQVALGRVVEVRLLEDEGHAEQALPEVDRGLPVGAHDGDVVDALGLKLFSPIAQPVSICTRCAAACPTGPARRESAPRARCEAARGSTRRARRRPARPAPARRSRAAAAPA